MEREDGKDCVAYDSANRIFVPRNCSDELDAVCFIRKRLSKCCSSFEVTKKMLKNRQIYDAGNQQLAVGESGCDFDDSDEVWEGGSTWGLATTFGE